MTGEQGIVRGVSWRDFLPSIVLFQALRLALRPSLIALATVGVLLNPLGWRLAEVVFLAEASDNESPVGQLAARQCHWPAVTRSTPPGTQGWLSDIEGRVEGAGASLVAHPIASLTSPFQVLFSGKPLSVGQILYLVTGSLWSLAIWGAIGGTLARISVVQFGLEQRIGMTDALGLVVRRWRSLIVAPLMPVGAVLVLTAPCVVIGWLMRLDLGVLLAGIVWPLVAIASLLMALLVIGFAFGWPLMPVAIVAEDGGDQFEAFHRSYSYLFGKPLHFACYVAVAGVLGVVGCVFVDALADLTLRMSGWAVSWGTGADRWTEIATAARGGDADAMFWAGTRLVGLVEQCVGIVAVGFRYSFFWCSAAAIYLLMRQQVDDAEFDELCVDEEESSTAEPEGATETANNENEDPS